ncbi:MAG: hypothetical protein STHCBS139747_005989 [Sporothrix thermara]
MGQHFSVIFPDTSKDVISPSDATAELFLALAWLCTFYGIGMIFTTTQIIDRWRGPRDDIPTGLASVLAALLLSAAWPVVLTILFFSSS